MECIDERVDTRPPLFWAKRHRLVDGVREADWDIGADCSQRHGGSREAGCHDDLRCGTRKRYGPREHLVHNAAE
jgi:hypothetical protein